MCLYYVKVLSLIYLKDLAIKAEKMLTNLQNYGMLFLKQADTSEEHSAHPLVSVNDQKIKKGE